MAKVVTSTAGAAAPEAAALMRRYGIALTSDNMAALAAYRARIRRARWWGVAGAAAAAAFGWLGSSGDAAGVGVARLVAGYLVGSVACELLTPQRRAVGAVHSASLVSREPELLLPLWARITPWLVLVPCLLAPLAMVGDHPTGVTHIKDRTGSATVTAHWFASSALIGIAALAAIGLVLWRLVLHRLAGRRLPLDSSSAAQLDLLTRALSARAASGAATALGLSLLAGFAYLSVEPLVSMACTTPADCHFVYAWHDHYDLVQNLGMVALLAAFLTFLWGRRPRVPESSLLSAGRESR